MGADNIEQQLQRMQAELDLKALINAYHWRADQFDWQGWSECFTEDAEFDFVGAFGVMRGRDEIRETCKGNMDHIYQVMQHIMVNLHFELGDADNASGRGNLIFIGVPDASKQDQNYMSGGRYEWRFKRTPQGWKIAHTRLQFLWTKGEDVGAVFE